MTASRNVVNKEFKKKIHAGLELTNGLRDQQAYLLLPESEAREFIKV